MDMYTGLDANYLVGAGLKETIAYLERSERPESRKILEYLNNYFPERELDVPERLRDWEQFRHTYFGYPRPQ